MTDLVKNNYWNNTGKYQHLIGALEALIPDAGSVKNPAKNKALEKFRRAANTYYDLFNNGGGNRPTACAKLFGTGITYQINAPFCSYQSIFARTEPVMDAIILAACEEQGISEQLELFAA